MGTVEEGVRAILELVRRNDRVLQNRLLTFEDRLQAIDDKLCKLAMSEVTKKQKNALRRQFYRERRELALKDRISLPDFNIFNRKDRRLDHKHAEWAQVGMRFGEADAPGSFIRWLVWQWNNATYIKKPVTFSGSAFQIWNGHCRYGYGPGDLIHLYRKRVCMVPFLRTEAEKDDFSKRPFWIWGSSVLLPVVALMKMQPAWGATSERWKTFVTLLCGGYAELKIGECNWDFYESRENINSMMKKIVHIWKPLLEAVVTGLRASESPPVPAVV